MDIDDFDDGFDDIQLDAESLKALQDTEDRYTLYSQTSGIPTVKKEQPNHPSSRLNVVSSTRPTRIVVKHENEDDLLPDVSVNSDGTYSFQPTQRSSKQPPPPRLASSLAQPKGASLSKTPTPTGRPERLRGSFVPPTNTTAFARPIAPLPKSRENLSVLGPRRTNNGVDARSIASTSRVGAQERHRIVMEEPQPHIKPVVTSPRSHVSVSNPSGEVEKLRREMERLRTEKESMAKSLTDTQNAKLTRDGEIATLRRTMEKQAAAHTDALSRVRAEKSSIESKKVVMEAELKAEMERLKSKLVFKQQEIETTAMRYLSGPPSTARRNRFVQPSQPHVTPVQSRTTPVRSFIDASPTVRKPTTPVHRRIMPMEKSVAKKENSPFPGFHDSFQSRGIRRSPSKKSAVVLATDNDRPPMPMSSQERLHISSDDPFQDSQPVALPNEEEEEEAVAVQAQEEEPVRWRINWSEELHNLVLTHCSLLSGSQTPQPTMQILLSVAIPSSEDMSHLERYVRACGDLLTAFGIIGNQTSHSLNPEEDVQYQHLVTAVGTSFLSMASIFLKLKMTSNIQRLLQLLQAVVLAVPSFREYLLTTPLSPNEPRSLHENLCVYLREHLDQNSPSQSTIGREGDDLSVDVLELLESLYWTVPDLHLVNFEVFTSDVPLLSNLLEPSQPRWLIQRTMKLLMFLSTHVQLVPTLIARGENQPSGPLHHVDVMLNHIHKIQSQASLKIGCNLIHSILIFLTNICIMHGKVEAMLTDFPNLAPSLLLCLTEISNRLWRDDEETCTAPDEDLDALVDILIPSLNLFHYLFYGIDFDSQSLALDLRNVIFQAAAQPAFNGIDHLYIVTMARLGYADAPDWLGDQRVVLVEDVQMVARELLEMLVDGPEGDLVISAYCGDETGGSQRQEETQDDFPNDVMDLDP